MGAQASGQEAMAASPVTAPPGVVIDDEALGSDGGASSASPSASDAEVSAAAGMEGPSQKGKKNSANRLLIVTLDSLLRIFHMKPSDFSEFDFDAASTAYLEDKRAPDTNLFRRLHADIGCYTIPVFDADDGQLEEDTDIDFFLLPSPMLTQKRQFRSFFIPHPGAVAAAPAATLTLSKPTKASSHPGESAW